MWIEWDFSSSFLKFCSSFDLRTFGSVLYQVWCSEQFVQISKLFMNSRECTQSLNCYVQNIWTWVMRCFPFSGWNTFPPGNKTFQCAKNVNKSTSYNYSDKCGFQFPFSLLKYTQQLLMLDKCSFKTDVVNALWLYFLFPCQYIFAKQIFLPTRRGFLREVLLSLLSHIMFLLMKEHHWKIATSTWNNF